MPGGRRPRGTATQRASCTIAWWADLYLQHSSRLGQKRVLRYRHPSLASSCFPVSCGKPKPLHLVYTVHSAHHACLQLLHHWLRMGRCANGPDDYLSHQLQPSLQDRLVVIRRHPLHLRSIRMGVSQQPPARRPSSSLGRSNSLRARLVNVPRR